MKDNNHLQPKTRTELARAYGIDRKTLYNWIKKMELPVKNGLLSTKCLKIIYSKYGRPRTKD